jgi:hypothetical protein
MIHRRTENLSKVNAGPRPDVLEVLWVRIEAESRLDAVRSAGSILQGDCGGCTKVVEYCETLSWLPGHAELPQSWCLDVVAYHEVPNFLYTRQICK